MSVNFYKYFEMSNKPYVNKLVGVLRGIEDWEDPAISKQTKMKKK